MIDTNVTLKFIEYQNTKLCNSIFIELSNNVVMIIKVAFILYLCYKEFQKRCVTIKKV